MVMMMVMTIIMISTSRVRMMPMVERRRGKNAQGFNQLFFIAINMSRCQSDSDDTDHNDYDDDKDDRVHHNDNIYVFLNICIDN